MKRRERLTRIRSDKNGPTEIAQSCLHYSAEPREVK
jgi:hypothetical protein